MPDKWKPIITDSAITPDDGVVSLPVGNQESTAMDEVIAKQMDQSFAKFHAQFDANAVRHNDTAEFITEQTKTSFLLERQLIGAKAAGQLDRDSLAKTKMDQQTSGG